MSINFEKISEDKNSKTYRIEAIHVTTTGNRRKYTKEELQLGARSLSFRPLNINHDEAQNLAYPANQTLSMDFDESKLAIAGTMRISDPIINQMIEVGRINKLSIEQIPTKGEACSMDHCEQKGITFVGLALLTSDTTPGYPKTIIAKESVNECAISDLLLSQYQKSVKEECKCRQKEEATVKAEEEQVKKEETKEVNAENNSSLEIENKNQSVMSEVSNEKLNKEAEIKVPGVLENKIVGFTAEQYENLKNFQQKQLEALNAAILGLTEAVKPKAEAVPSSTVDDVESKKKREKK